jgi:hypothetical protein
VADILSAEGGSDDDDIVVSEEVSSQALPARNPPRQLFAWHPSLCGGGAAQAIGGSDVKRFAGEANGSVVEAKDEIGKMPLNDIVFSVTHVQAKKASKGAPSRMLLYNAVRSSAMYSPVARKLVVICASVATAHTFVHTS